MRRNAGNRIRVLTSRLARPLAVLAACVFVTPRVASAPPDAMLEYRDIPEPTRVVVEMESDLLAYDLCWSDDVESARAALAQRIIKEAPAAGLFVVELPELPERWRPISPRSMRTMDGALMDRRRIARGMRTYEEDLEEALVDVLGRVQEALPEAMIAIEGFAPRRSRTGPLYESLVDSFDYIFVDENFEKLFRRYERRRDMAWKIEREFDWLESFGWGGARPLVLRYADKWVFAAYEELPSDEAITARSEDELLDEAPEDFEEHTDQLATNDLPKPAGIEPPDLEPIPTDHIAGRGGGSLAPAPTGAEPAAAAPENPYDLNSDGAVNQADTSIVLGSWGTNNPLVDFDGSGEVDAHDLALILGSYTTPAEPEPDKDPPAETGTTLIAGDGFSGSTPQPGPVGSLTQAGFDAKAIARWDVVPYQTVDEAFGVGVAAFHMNGIDRVEFSLEGGPWMAVEDATLNPRTGVEEYWINFDPAEVEDGLVEIRAVVYPTTGEPRVLAGPIEEESLITGEHSMFVNGNAGGSLPVEIVTLGPSDDLAAAIASTPEGGEIHLGPGDYDIADMRRARKMSRWLTIRPAPGVAREQVRIRPPFEEGRRYMVIKGQLIRWKDLTFDLARIQRIVPHPPTSKHPGDSHWFDGCYWTDTNGWDHTYPRNIPTPFNGSGVWYSTDSEYFDTRFGPMRHQLVRGADIRRISGEVFEGSRVVIDTDIENVDGSILENAVHTDIVQWHDSRRRRIENQILYGVRGQSLFSQHFFLRTGGGATYEDIAFVDIMFKTKDEIRPSTGRPLRDHTRSQLYCFNDHVIFRNVRSDIPLNLRTADTVGNPDEGYVARNVVFENCGFPAKTRQQLVVEAPEGILAHNVFEWTWWENE